MADLYKEAAELMLEVGLDDAGRYQDKPIVTNKEEAIKSLKMAEAYNSKFMGLVEKAPEGFAEYVKEAQERAETIANLITNIDPVDLEKPGEVW